VSCCVRVTACALSRSPLVLSCRPTPPPTATPLECWQCVCMEAQLMPSHASFVLSNLPPCDPQRITQAHSPRLLCHAFESTTVGVHAYKVATPVFHFLSHARAMNGARPNLGRWVFNPLLPREISPFAGIRSHTPPPAHYAGTPPVHLSHTQTYRAWSASHTHEEWKGAAHRNDARTLTLLSASVSLLLG
jgi:hypothetical protein